MLDLGAAGQLHTVLVQIDKRIGNFSYNLDTLFIGKDCISYGGRGGTLEAELREIELALANAMRQLDA
jgi:hypothetical protein